MGSSTSGRFGFAGANRIWIELTWSENISGTSNSVNIEMKVHTLYRISGRWRCVLKVNGVSEKDSTVGMYWGGSSYGGSKTVQSVNKVFNYSGNKRISIEGQIVNMDYYDVGLGPSSSQTKTLSHYVEVDLATTNTPPPTPNIFCTNSSTNGKYLAEDAVNIELGHVSDPQGDTVTYAAYAEYMPPGGNSWQNAGDANKCILYSSSSRSVAMDVKKYARGTRFRVWGRAIDNHGASSSNTGYIDNIYRNKTPNTVKEFIPNGGIFNDNFTTRWDNPGDPDGNVPNFKLWISKNDGDWSLIQDSTGVTSYSRSLEDDPEGTSYKLRICTTDGLTESAYLYSDYFKKNTKPTTPNYIFPNSGYALGVTTLSWNASTDPDQRGIDYYNVRINGVKVGTTNTTSFDWIVPNEDNYNTAYLISVQAVDKDGKASEWGYATGQFYKASPPAPPSWIKPAENYHEDYINLEWENISSNGVVVTYSLDYRIDQGSWITINNELKVNKYKHDIRNIARGARIDYRVSCKNSFDQTSGYFYREKYYRNRIPIAPKIIMPLTNSSVYDTSPRIAFEIAAEPDNQEQILYVKCNDITYNSKNHKDMFSRKEGAFINKTNIVFMAKGLKAGTNKIVAYVNDGLINSPETTITLNVLNCDLIAKKDEYIYADMFNTAREQINCVRRAYGLNDYNFVNKILVGGVVKFDYIQEMRDAILAPRIKLNDFDSSNSNLDISTNWLSVNGTNYIFKDYMQQIIDMIKHL